MHKIHYNVFSSHGEKYGYFALDHMNQTAAEHRCDLVDNVQLADKTSKLSSKNISVLNTPSMNRNRADSATRYLFDKFMTPFRKMGKRPSQAGQPSEQAQELAQKRMQLLSNLDRSNSFYTAARKRSYEELDAKTQLIINYARIDAISNTSHSRKTHPHLGNTSMEMGQFIRPSPSRTSHLNSSSIVEETGFNELSNQMSNSKTTGNPRNNRLLPSTGQQRHQPQQRSTLNLDVFESDPMSNSKMAADRKLSSAMLQATIAKMRLLNRRRHSWPRAKYDHLHFNNINRKMRYYYQEQEKVKYQLKKGQKRSDNEQEGPVWHESRAMVKSRTVQEASDFDDVDSEQLGLDVEEDFERGYSDNIFIFQTMDASNDDNETTKGNTDDSSRPNDDDEPVTLPADFSNRVVYV